MTVYKTEFTRWLQITQGLLEWYMILIIALAIQGTHALQFLTGFLSPCKCFARIKFEKLHSRL